jgi:hypothetical protein
MSPHLMLLPPDTKSSDQSRPSHLAPLGHNPPSDVKNVPASHKVHTLELAAPARATENRHTLGSPSVVVSSPQRQSYASPHKATPHLTQSSMSPSRKASMHPSASLLYTLSAAAMTQPRHQTSAHLCRSSTSPTDTDRTHLTLPMSSITHPLSPHHSQVQASDKPKLPAYPSHA